MQETSSRHNPHSEADVKRTAAAFLNHRDQQRPQERKDHLDELGLKNCALLAPASN